jgi:hypothetical protein
LADAFQQRKPYPFNESDFFCRYASGGALPRVRFGNKTYYCLFYRDVFPVGWNIVNGESDSRDELHDPERIIEREFAEELMVADERSKTRLLFQWHDKQHLHLPEYISAWEMWRSRQPMLSDFGERDLKVAWQGGPDFVTIADECGEGARESASPAAPSAFLNVNALDLSIEVDKIADIHVADSAIDGEDYREMTAAQAIEEQWRRVRQRMRRKGMTLPPYRSSGMLFFKSAPDRVDLTGDINLTIKLPCGTDCWTAFICRVEASSPRPAGNRVSWTSAFTT